MNKYGIIYGFNSLAFYRFTWTEGTREASGTVMYWYSYMAINTCLPYTSFLIVVATVLNDFGIKL